MGAWPYAANRAGRLRERSLVYGGPGMVAPHPGVASAVYDHITSALPTDGLFGRRSIVVARRRTDERACCREYLHWKIGPD